MVNNKLMIGFYKNGYYNYLSNHAYHNGLLMYGFWNKNGSFIGSTSETDFSDLAICYRNMIRCEYGGGTIDFE